MNEALVSARSVKTGKGKPWFQFLKHRYREMSRQRGNVTQKHSGQFTYPIISARSVRSSTRYFFKRSFMIGISRKERRARALSENFGGIEEPFRREVLNKFLSIIEWQHKRSQ